MALPMPLTVGAEHSAAHMKSTRRLLLSCRVPLFLDAHAEDRSQIRAARRRSLNEPHLLQRGVHTSAPARVVPTDSDCATMRYSGTRRRSILDGAALLRYRQVRTLPRDGTLVCRRRARPCARPSLRSGVPSHRPTARPPTAAQQRRSVECDHSRGDTGRRGCDHTSTVRIRV